MTIYDIARQVGVSPSSVSRVINNKPGVNPETRQKILRLVEENNYSPNAIARGLVNQSSKTIGILVADIRNIHHTDGAYYIERELVGRGYCCIILNTGHEDSEKVNAIDILKRRRVEGVVMMGSIFQCSAVKDAITQCLSDIPVAIINGWIDLPNVYGILSDELGGLQSCVQLLIEKGRRRIAFICDKPYNPSNRLKEKGYLMGAESLDINAAEWSYRTENALEGGYEATLQVLREHPDVDGIVYGIDLLAAGGLQALHDKQIDVPEQIAIVGVNNSMYAEICTPPLTSLDNKRLEASIMAARIIIDTLSGQKPSRRMVLLPELVERKST
ncbi:MULTISPECIES: LacI family DNA-binding transcriptional regulator [Anaerotruncus]|uniref:LacI family DNA-binding transcriptional regulator n=1 Tax=Anaerotruncus TaxID=244127 RepID=UPI00082F80F5|nr:MULTISPECIES: LacI family DNA-binding transcriptional regulator [Anaerotruncus]RGX55214.1 LacI family transcriptional regulator [Anaerotruncus sp. AF02-27]